MQVVVVEVRLGLVGVPVFHSLSLCLDVYLLSTVWFGTHPLLLQIFVGYKPGFLWYLSFSSFPRLLGDCPVAVSIAADFLLLNYDLVLF